MTGKTKIVLVVLGLGLAGLTTLRVADALTRRSSAAEETAPDTKTPVDVVRTTPRDLVETLTVAGSLRALHEAEVVADVPGRVVSVLVDVGAPIRKGEALARLESSDLVLQLAQAEASLAAAEASRDAAVRDQQGVDAVAKVGGVTDSQIVAARSRADAAQAQVKQAEAALGLARARLGDATLRSPIDGVVTRRRTDLGQMVSPGMSAFTVADLSSLELEVAVDERAAARIQVGDPAGVQSEAATGPLQGGTVKTVSPALDASTRKAQVILSLPYQPGLLPHGTASARFTLGKADSALAVPAQAILQDQGESYVFVVEDGLARRKVVQPGIREGDWVQITGVEADAQVIVAGNNFVSDGTPVQIREQEPS